jgi:Fe-S-cluster containining protein
MHKFSCKNCGECCKDFGSFGTLPIFLDEKARYKRLAEEKGFSLEFVPENIWLDRISGTVICLNWGMKGSPCKFLRKDNFCGIYSDRSLICKAFPIEKFPEKGECIKLGCFMDCAKCNLNDFVHEANLVKEDKLSWFKEAIGQDSFDARVEIERRKRFIGESFKELENQKKS